MQKSPLTPEDFYRFTFLGAPHVISDGTVLYVETTVVEAEGAYRRRIMAVSSEGGAPRALTHGISAKGGPANDSAPSVSRDGVLWFLSDRSGAPEVWRLPLSGGEGRALTAFGPGRLGGLRAAPDGAGALVISRAGRAEGDDAARVLRRLRYRADGLGFVDGRRRLVLVRPDAPEQPLTDPDDDVMEAVFAADGASILFVADRRPEAEFEQVPQIYRLPLSGGTPERVHEGAGPIHDLAPSPDGRHLYFYGHRSGEEPGMQSTLMRLDLATGEAVDWAADGVWEAGNHIGSDSRDDGGSAAPRPMADGSVIWLGTCRGRSTLLRTPAGGGAAAPQGAVADASVSSYALSEDGAHAAVCAATATDPGTLEWRVMDGGESRALVRPNAFLRERYVAAAERVETTAPDGTPIDGWFLRPRGAAPYPTVLEVHGGPHAAYGHAFFLEFQILAGRGFGVLYTNPRGSAGYGPAFRRACVGDWGGKDCGDLMAAVDRATAMGLADPDRLGITGGSYGGFMTNWVVTQTTRFRVRPTIWGVEWHVMADSA